MTELLLLPTFCLSLTGLKKELIDLEDQAVLVDAKAESGVTEGFFLLVLFSEELGISECIDLLGDGGQL